MGKVKLNDRERSKFIDWISEQQSIIRDSIQNMENHNIDRNIIIGVRAKAEAFRIVREQLHIPDFNYERN